MATKNLVGILGMFFLFGCCETDPYMYLAKNAPPKQEQSASVLDRYSINLEHPIKYSGRFQEKVDEYSKKNNIKIFFSYVDDSVVAMDVGDRCGNIPSDEQISKYISGLPEEILKESKIPRRKKHYDGFGMPFSPRLLE